MTADTGHCLLLAAYGDVADLHRQLRLARDVLSTIVDGAPLSFEAQMTLTAMALLAVSQAIRDAEALQPPDAVEDGTAE